MKKSTLILIIIGLISLLSAVAGALYVLKKRGILFIDDDYDYDADDFEIPAETEDKQGIAESPRKSRVFSKKADETADASPDDGSDK